MWLLKSLNSQLLRFQFLPKWLKPQSLLMSDFRFLFTCGPAVFPLHPWELCCAFTSCLLFFIHIFIGVFIDRTSMIYYFPYSPKHWIFGILLSLVIWFIKAHPLGSSNSRGEFTTSKYMPFLRNNMEVEKKDIYWQIIDQNSMYCSPKIV